MTNDSQFIKTKQAVNDLFKQLDEQSLTVRDTLKEQLTEQFAKISEVVEQANTKIDKFTAERKTIENEQLNKRIAKLDAFCNAHEGTSFDILKPYTVNVFVCGKTYSIDVFDDDYLDSKLQKIDDLLKISKQLDESSVNHRLKKSYYPFGGVDKIRLILDKFGQIGFDFTIENDDTVKLKAEYMSDSLEYLKRQIDPTTTFEVEVGTRDHEEFLATIKSIGYCKLENIAFKMQKLAEHVSDNIDFEME